MIKFSTGANRIVTSTGIIEDGFVNVSGNRVESITGRPLHDLLDRFNADIIMPGFIDIHTHGYFGIDAMKSSENDIHRWASMIAGHGVTSFIPTCVSAPADDLINFLRKINTVRSEQSPEEAHILGARSEGPYISGIKRGAHNRSYVRGISMEEIQNLIKSSSGVLRIMDMAPELEGFNEAMSLLQSSGTAVSAGHSGADYGTSMNAISSGVRLMTHFYNAMTQFDHRSPGMVGAGLLNSGVNLEIIADFHHVSREAIRIMSAMAGWNRIIAITDSVPIGGTSDEESELGGLMTEIHDGVAWIKGTDIIAGSVLTMDRAFSNILSLGVDLPDLVKAFSRNPAELLGLNDMGDIAPGKIADINFLDSDMNIIGTLIAGIPLKR